MRKVHIEADAFFVLTPQKDFLCSMLTWVFRYIAILLFFFLGSFLNPSLAQRPVDVIEEPFSADAFNNAFNQISDLYIRISNELLKTNAINTTFYFVEDTVDIQREWFFHLTENIKNTSKMYTQSVQIYANGKYEEIKIDTFIFSLDTSIIKAKTDRDRENQIFSLRNEQVKEFLNKQKEKVFSAITSFSEKEYIDSLVYDNYLIQSKRNYTKTTTIDMDKSFHLIYTVLRDRNFLSSLKSIRLAPNSVIRVNSAITPLDNNLMLPIKYIVHVNSNRARLSHTDSTFGQPSERLSISTNEIMMSFSLEQRKITYEQLAKRYIDECYKEFSGRWTIIINKGDYKQSTSFAAYNKVTRKWTCGTVYTAKDKSPSSRDIENITKMQSLLQRN